MVTALLVVGLGVATGALNQAIMFRIVSAWIVALPGGPTVGTLAGSRADQQADAERRTEAVEGSDASVSEVPPIGEGEFDELAAESLFDPAAAGRIVFLWVLTPTLSATGAYLLFALLL